MKLDMGKAYDNCIGCLLENDFSIHSGDKLTE